MPEIYWVDAALGCRIAILERPRGGEWLKDEARDLKARGVDVVVSLLTPEEEDELGLGGEKEAVEAQGLKYISFPIEDCGTPASMSQARALIAGLAASMKAGKAIGLHCRAGIGRSPMIAAAVMSASGIPVDRALKALSEARGWSVPETGDQRKWVERQAASFRLRRGP
jgi:protein-tyrosine phosphatase